jgi:hypothetical protein
MFARHLVHYTTPVAGWGQDEIRTNHGTTQDELTFYRRA